jgi:hypothetical protein
LLLAQRQTNSLFTLGDDPAQAFRDDYASFGDIFGDQTQNLGDDNSEEEVALSELASNGASKDGKVVTIWICIKSISAKYPVPVPVGANGVWHFVKVRPNGLWILLQWNVRSLVGLPWSCSSHPVDIEILI